MNLASRLSSISIHNPALRIHLVYYALSFLLLFISGIYILYQITSGQTKEQYIFHADLDPMNEAVSVYAWNDDTSLPVSIKKQPHPSKPNDQVLFIEKPQSAGYSGIGKILGSQINLSRPKVLEIHLKNITHPLFLQIKFPTKEGYGGASPIEWTKSITLEHPGWHVLRVPIASLYLSKDFEITAEQHVEYDPSSIESILFIFFPDQDIEMLLDYIRVVEPVFSWGMLGIFLLNFIWWGFLVSFTYCAPHSVDYATILGLFFKFCLFQCILVFSLPHFSHFVFLSGVFIYFIGETVILLRPHPTRLQEGLGWISPLVLFGAGYYFAEGWPLLLLLVAGQFLFLIRQSHLKPLFVCLAAYSGLCAFIYMLPLLAGDPGIMLVGLCVLFSFWALLKAQEGYFGLVQQQQKLNQQLDMQWLHTQRLESTTYFTRGVAHEFNNLLTCIIGYLNLIQAKQHEDIQTYVENATHSAQRMTELIQQLRQFSQHNKMEYSSFPIEDLLDECQTIMLRKYNIPIERTAEDSNPLHEICGDRLRLKIAIMNLLANARDAIHEMQSACENHTPYIAISVSVMRHQPLPWRTTALKEKEFVKIDIFDNGVGIAESDVDKIFDPFFSTKDVDKGVGLGLSSAYGIVKQHNGWITVESQPQQGTHAMIYLPALCAVNDCG